MFENRNIDWYRIKDNFGITKGFLCSICTAFKETITPIFWLYSCETSLGVISHNFSERYHTTLS